MKLKLKVSQLRALQKKHGLENILQPSAEDLKKMLSLDFLTDFVTAGTSHWETKPDVEEMELHELTGYFKGWQAGEDAEGKPPE